MSIVYIAKVEYAELKIFKCICMPGGGIVSSKQMENIEESAEELIYNKHKQELNKRKEVILTEEEIKIVKNV